MCVLNHDYWVASRHDPGQCGSKRWNFLEVTEPKARSFSCLSFRWCVCLPYLTFILTISFVHSLDKCLCFYTNVYEFYLFVLHVISPSGAESIDARYESEYPLSSSIIVVVPTVRNVHLMMAFSLACHSHFASYFWPKNTHFEENLK